MDMYGLLVLFQFYLGYGTRFAQGISVTEFLPPRIFPEEKELSVRSSDNVTLRCEGKSPLTWAYPNDTTNSDNPHSSTITILDSDTPDADFKYGSLLHIQNASYMDTGFYYCHEEDADVEDLSKISNIYLFVEDDNNLMVDENFEVVIAREYSNAVIPCRPTSPNVEVKLIKAGREGIHMKVPLNTIDGRGAVVTFDPRHGLNFSEVTQDDSLLYQCQIRKGDAVVSKNIVLKVQPITDPIATPKITDSNSGHTVVGNQLILSCILNYDGTFAMEWIIPDKTQLQSGRIHQTRTEVSPNDSKTYTKKLIIDRTTMDDQGEYTCLVKDHMYENSHTVFIRIFGEKEYFINLTEPNGVYSISTHAGEKSVQWTIDVKAHPLPKLSWYDNKGKLIQSGWSDSQEDNKYKVRTKSDEAFLKIYDITIFDRGYYRLSAMNDFGEEYLDLFLNVTDKPSVHIEMSDYHMYDEPDTIKCVVAGYPDPSIYWFFLECHGDKCIFNPVQETRSEVKGLQHTSYLTITAKKSGYIRCYANNSLGEDSAMSPYFVTDVEHGFGIWVSQNVIQLNETQNIVASDDEVTLHCGASVYNYTNQIDWFYRNGSQLTIIDTTNHFTVEKSYTDYSYRTALTIKRVSYNDSGNYTCGVKTSAKGNQLQFQNTTLIVKDPELPYMFDSNLNNTEVVTKLAEKVELYCYAGGIPKPKITWYKNNAEFVQNSHINRVILKEEGSRLILKFTIPEDEGSYRCVASNFQGNVEKSISLKIKDKPIVFTMLYIVIIVALSFVLVITVIYIIIRIRIDKKREWEIKKAGLDKFNQGAVDCLNPELGVDDQAELLPYDKKWEFPRDKLKLGKQLGSGAFGVVMKGNATGIAEGGDSTIVAVKMVKPNADYTYLKALADELKIMVHLGKHLNVVNLLGACTKNIAKRELLVIVEYCRYGNIQNYLLRHRNSFINQIHPGTGKTDFTLGTELLERTLSVSSERSNASSKPNLNYAALSFPHSTSNGVPNNMADYRGNSVYSAGTTYTQFTTVSMTPTGGEDAIVNTSESLQPEWRSNYRGDYRGNVRPICTKDLLTWAFQVARGMEYLSSRKVLHGDLAARNILLSENNIVKICDFGLAKRIYRTDNYKKKGDGPLPVKWMAVESIRDRIFSTQSDVWSFGIVLWELFSLARTPYPGMEADERLYNKLIDGYRMECPEYATKSIYKIMSDCWESKPPSRPSFTKLADRLGCLLEDSVRQHYIDLNDPYLVMNTQTLTDQSDYLQMMSPPDFDHLATPPPDFESMDIGRYNQPYVNQAILSGISPDTPGYLCMKVNNAVPNEGCIFRFDVDQKRNKVINTESASGTELLPMLQTYSESDCESPMSPKYADDRSFSNPSYHMPPVIAQQNDGGIVKSNDNYVNMPENKSALKSNKTSTKNVNVFNERDAPNYVNCNSADWERAKC